jgi:hypothetical protein
MIRFPVICAVSFILFVFGTHRLFGQNNFQKGYVVTVAGDTLRGNVDYLNWEKNPKKITFQDWDSSRQTEFSPTDLVSFSVMDEIYVSALVDTEVSSSNTNQLVSGKHRATPKRQTES